LKIDEEFERMKPIVLGELIQAKVRQGKIDEGMKITESLIEATEGSWFFVRLKGWIQHEAGKFEDSAKTYQSVIEKLEADKEMKDELRDSLVESTRYILSGVYMEMNQIDKSAEQLQVLLKKHPDSATYNNDLGYIWADHGKNLDESEKMIRKAIEEDRKKRKEAIAKQELSPEDDHDNAAYIDSLGWVLYKKKQYAEAKKHLQEAVKDKEGQHVEIMDHLADVHMALGEKDEAIAVWKQALDTDPQTKRDHKRMEEVRKKLKAAQGK
jgi:tetratricopeptide (TPR) repeat protein